MKRIVYFCAAAGTLFAAFMASAATRYVDLNNPAPASPYTNWATAATIIQDAVDAAVDGDEIVVTNGVYATGGRAVYGTMTNRLAINKAVTVRSVNGPPVTVIQGFGVGTGATNNGDGAIRCVYVGTNAVLSGFTLTNGHTREAGDGVREQSGGGASCELSGVLTNCALINNSAYGAGGGATYGALNNCTLSSNKAESGGGAYGGTLNNCTLSGNRAGVGGGAYGSTLSNCTLIGNSAGGADGAGGGAYSGTLNNCALIGNSATAGNGAGGGAYHATLNNCTLIGNLTPYVGGGVYYGTLNNCVVYYNSAPNGSNYYDSYSTFNYSCTTPLPSGPGNITNAPLFVNTNGWANLRLQSNSPCINSGRNAYATNSTDLDGNPRIRGGTVDMGAYEFQNPASVISYAWLQSYGLPTDGSSDFVDTDGDGMNSWQEWVAGTNPTNSASVLRMVSAMPGASNVGITWSSVSNRSYSLARATNLGAVPAFSMPWSNIAGLPGTTSYTDTNPPAGSAAFYRVAVQQP